MLHFSKVFMACSLFLIMICKFPAAAQQFIHEAFITKISSMIALEAIEQTPPQEIQERIPRQIDPRSMWVPGYWAWSQNINDFIWISGVWRVPPPAMGWIPGEWKLMDEGWVWLEGFWSPSPLKKLTFNDSPPPEPLDDQNVPPPPNDNFFWRSGYWKFYPEQHQYLWSFGNWEPLDPNWILVPAQYIWRPEGYALIPAFWDWVLMARGRVYPPKQIPAYQRGGAEYLPQNPILPEYIMMQMFTDYPDYAYLYEYYYHYNPQFWQDVAPPWWAWINWWSLSWEHQWGLWWWYTHPGYPQPSWISSDISSQIPPPKQHVIDMMQRVKSPFFITPNGIIPLHEFLEPVLSGKSKSKMPPIFPANALKLQSIQKKINPKNYNASSILRPSGAPMTSQNAPNYAPPIRPSIPSQGEALKLWEQQQSKGFGPQVQQPTLPKPVYPSFPRHQMNPDYSPYSPYSMDSQYRWNGPRGYPAYPGPRPMQQDYARPPQPVYRPSPLNRPYPPANSPETQQYMQDRNQYLQNQYQNEKTPVQGPRSF
jgi:hypothetical protein